MELDQFAQLITTEQHRELSSRGLDCESNLNNTIAIVKPGRKYTRIDIGTSGRYMIENETGRIYGIKAYGVIHRGHYFGTLETINEWYWGQYHAIKKPAS